MRTSTAVMLGSAAIVAGYAVASKRNRERLNLRSMPLQGKVVLITGASHGLGLALARGFAARGCKLAICARTAVDLAVAEQSLRSRGAEVLAVPCDVADPVSVEGLITLTHERYGHLDILVNNAGIIQVGPVDATTTLDFEQAMDTMFWGTVHTTRAALPYMYSLGQARIVNITSVGGKVSIPHLIPYSCAKFACAAFSEGLRAELNGTGVKVVTIAPGLMRTGSHFNAVFKGAEKSEAGWFSLAASLPGISMSAERAANQIIAATVAGTAERTLGAPANLISWFHGLFPGATSDLLGLVNRALPRGGRDKVRGGDTATLRNPLMQAVTVLGRQAARKLLQPDARAAQRVQLGL